MGTRRCLQGVLLNTIKTTPPTVRRYATATETVVPSSSRQLIGLEHDYSAHKYDLL